MSELQELWQQVTQYDRKYINPRLYAVVEALVGVAEPEECPQGCDATIRKLREECNGLRDAKARIANGAWKHRQEIGRLCAKCDEAKAEIEVLHNQGDYLLQQRDKALAEIETLKAGHDHWETRYLEAEDLLAKALRSIQASE